MLASDVMDLAASVCNDTAKERFTYTAQLPYLKLAIAAIELKLINNQVDVNKEESAIIVLPVNTISLAKTGSPALPADFKEPILLEERLSGSDELFQKMSKEEWEPETSQSESLNVWTYREGEVKLVGATTVRDLKISYYKTLATITSENSVISDNNLLAPLSFYQAALLSRYIGENYQRYNDIMNGEYRDSWESYLQIQVKRNQANPTRRSGFRERLRNVN